LYTLTHEGFSNLDEGAGGKMLTLERMRYLVRKGLGGLDEEDMPNEDVDELLNLALWNLSERFPFKEKECLVTGIIQPGQVEVGITEDMDAIYSLSIRHGDDGDLEKLARRSMDWMEQHRVKEGDLLESDPPPEDRKRGRPRFYTRWRNTIYIHPIPDKQYGIRLAYWRTVPSLLSGLVDTPELPRNWHEIVVEGAITRGHYFNEDYNLAQQAENFRLSHERSAVMVTSKEERDSRVAGLQVLHDFPPEDDVQF
jgi:hypothetical protein